MTMPRFYGKYRGKVSKNIDPLNLGRLQVEVPSVLGDGTLSWAMPCSPYAGDGVGWFAVPPDGSSVWVEFEGGDPDFPIWAGGFWGTGQVPVNPALPQTKVLKTDSITLTLDDTPGKGGLTLEVASPAVSVPVKVVVNSDGIEVTLDPAKITVKIDQIVLELPPATVTVKADSIELKNDPSTVAVTADKVEASNASATGSVSSSQIELSNGAGKVAVSASGVSVCDGALEVM